MFFVLWMVGLIVVSIELWGPTGSVNANCNNLVFNVDPTGSNNQEKLAWLMQKSICKLDLGVTCGVIVANLIFRSIMASRVVICTNWSYLPPVDGNHGYASFLRRVMDQGSTIDVITFRFVGNNLTVRVLGRLSCRYVTPTSI